MQDKAQSAIEYLMTYSWVLIIIVIAAGALYALGILNPATYTSTTCTGFTGLSYVEHKVTTGGVMTLILKNSAGKQITVTGMNVIPDGGTEQVVLSTGSGAYAPLATISLGSSAVTGWTGTAGDPFSGTVIVYYDTANIANNTARGTCTGTLT
ncbi:MAG: hypothetical protein JW834_05015 [Candidatus Diapherotrites archaeon]|nr:hypothetical protein [Candidatus Diapherotrites archaeon]